MRGKANKSVPQVKGANSQGAAKIMKEKGNRNRRLIRKIKVVDMAEVEDRGVLDWRSERPSRNMAIDWLIRGVILWRRWCFFTILFRPLCSCSVHGHCVPANLGKKRGFIAG
ncbi:hypothetical protein CEXT_609971 [Caerostris extrusa]|uniref:Uncharacterized protein n=1 Tax=Caerostris extrusa TaxID=172846 RepID=A0AAV4WCE4_CAEEX|nr:hypothetical protein CEXT_609971 [Caerostris extrusa]